MFRIYDGRTDFYQWDLDRKIIINDSSINQVHFCNRTDECSLVCEVYEENGQRLVNVPNVLLQTDWRINVYGYDKNYTKHSAVFNVIKRSKPENYVYTETEVLNYNTLLDMINNIEAGDVDLSNYYTKPEVDQKLSEIEVDVDLSDYAKKSDIPDTTGLATEKYVDDAIANIDIPEAESIDEVYVGTDKPTDEHIKLWIDTDEDVPFATLEYVDEKIEGIELTPGPQGEPGKNGLDGKDYVLTEEDKAEIAASVNLEDYAKKSDIPDTTGFTTEEEVIALIAEYGGGGDLPASEEGAF